MADDDEYQIIEDYGVEGDSQPEEGQMLIGNPNDMLQMDEMISPNDVEYYDEVEPYDASYPNNYNPNGEIQP